MVPSPAFGTLWRNRWNTLDEATTTEFGGKAGQANKAGDFSVRHELPLDPADVVRAGIGSCGRGWRDQRLLISVSGD